VSKPLTKERRALLQAIANDEHVANNDLLQEALESERFWRDAIAQRGWDVNYGFERNKCFFCDLERQVNEYHSSKNHKPDCAWWLAQETE